MENDVESLLAGYTPSLGDYTCSRVLCVPHKHLRLEKKGVHLGEEGRGGGGGGEVQGINTLFKTQMHELYTLFRQGSLKTIPYPAAHPRIANIGDYPSPPPPPGKRRRQSWQLGNFTSWLEFTRMDVTCGGHYSWTPKHDPVSVNVQFDLVRHNLMYSCFLYQVHRCSIDYSYTIILFFTDSYISHSSREMASFWSSMAVSM